jgi:hypothetical protein
MPGMVDATGSVMKQVTCESCGHQYEYKMTRTGHGNFCGYARTAQQADEKAAVEAAEKLKKALETECDVVPCPQCGALTRQMKAAEAAIVPQCLGGMGVGLLIVGGAYLFGRWTGRWFVVLGLIGVAAIVLSGLVLVIKFWECITGTGRKR